MITRRLLNAVSRLHSARLVARVEAQQTREERALDGLRIAERFSRWANEVKRQSRDAHRDEVERTEVLAYAVNAELDMLPALSRRAQHFE